MNSSWISRTAFTGAAAAIAVVVAAVPAFAHVSVSAPDAARGGSAILTFQVPNESATNSSTTELVVRIPGVTAVDTQAMPGWKAVAAKDSARNVTAVTWTADPGGGIGPGQFAQFSVLANGLPDTERLTMPAVQTYADGQVVKWEQEPTTGGPESEYPAPSLKLAAKHAGGVENHGDIPSAMPEKGGSTSDTTARWLGVIGIVLGALGLIAGIGLGVTRRKA
ncbi:YcnI family copper-binding membrane protein [Nocardia australiensis]|uniref:YcnI family copper-binding membrane protein n=1 Tax=Nocardia australiensis TaxID=2887191 RepID=UPI001D149FA1|nr:YcnI family protein [Nocardia australiensis]